MSRDSEFVSPLAVGKDLAKIAPKFNVSGLYFYFGLQTLDSEPRLRTLDGRNGHGQTLPLHFRRLALGN
jgi:hypothetical protein